MLASLGSPRVTRRATLAREERTADRAPRRRRAGVRRELRRPGCGARAGGRPAPTSCWSTATRSGNAPPRPAPRRLPGCTRWAWRARSDRRSPTCPSRRPTARCATGCRGVGRRSTTASCAACSTSRPTPVSRSRRWRRARAQAVQTDRGELRAPLVVDALGWRRVLAARGYQPPDAPLSRGPRGPPRWRRHRPRGPHRPLAPASRLLLERPRRASSSAWAPARTTRATT